jgi:hypothetical protein
MKKNEIKHIFYKIRRRVDELCVLRGNLNTPAQERFVDNIIYDITKLAKYKED